jgi:hypothetical protein
MKHGHYHRRSCQRWDTCWFIFFMQKDKAQPRFIVDCVVYTVIMLWVTVVWENGAENSGMGTLVHVTKVVKDNTQLWLINLFKTSTDACVENVVLRYQNSLKNFHKLRGLLCIELSRTDLVTISSVHGATKTNVMIRQVPKCGWQLCGEVMQLCM